MSNNASVSLGDYFDDFVETQVESGRFASASEVLRAGLRLLEEQEARLRRLREAIQEGEDSGAPEPFDIEEFLTEMNVSSAKNA